MSRPEEGRETGDVLSELRQGLSPREPLAARMRPRSLDEFEGQEHILGRGRLLRRAIEVDQLSSIIFHGPPGSGKTTLARVIAERTRSLFMTINAVLSGVADIRASIEKARRHREMLGQRSILFVDEVHRFNKAQQDALLPHVESGAIVLIGATTENPYFEVNKALLSRSRVFQMKSLGEGDLERILDRALADGERGYGALDIEMSGEARRHLIRVAGGDARNLLNALELAVETEKRKGGKVVIDLVTAEESIQEKAVLYDKDGDAHYDTISAFIKSLRGSDPDAALYWLARMLAAGEDPRFIFRRMLILASEDVGLAAPGILSQIVAAGQAFDCVGMPEGRFHLAQACLTLANAPKSNSAMALFDAIKAVKEENDGEVPDHLKDASRDAEALGHGQGYKYPHAFEEHWVAQHYLPEGLRGRVFYRPSRVGAEKAVHDEVERRREAALAAFEEARLCFGPAGASGGGDEASRARWMRRTMDGGTDTASFIRDRMIFAASISPDDLVLDLNAGTGLITWEALRRAHRGEVWSAVAREGDARIMNDLAAKMDYLYRPRILRTEEPFRPALLLQNEAKGVFFDRVLARHLLDRGEEDASGLLLSLLPALKRSGRAVLFDYFYKKDQRLSRILKDLAPQSAKSLVEKFSAVEEDYYEKSGNPMLRFDPAGYKDAPLPGLALVSLEVEPLRCERYFTEEAVREWFSPQSFLGAFLIKTLGAEDAAGLCELSARCLSRRSLSWERCYSLAVMEKSG